MDRGMRKKAFTAPGTLVYTGVQSGKSDISVVCYNEAEVKEKEIKNIDELSSAMDYDGNVYVEVKNVCDIAAVESVGGLLGLHKLVLEDILSVNQRAKIEEYNDYLYMSAYGMRNNDISEQSTVNISVIHKDNAVIVFIDGEEDFFSAVKSRIRESQGIVRKMKTDYLFYILTDTIIDSFYNYIHVLDDRSEEIERRVIRKSDDNVLDEIYSIKRQLILIKRILWPSRDMILKMNNSRQFSEKTLLYIRDLTDNTLHILESVESLRDVMGGILDIYLTQISNKMNEVMKVLTIIATIFIPLTFIAGIYGMNFMYMPELNWRWAYPAVWLIMGFISLIMLLFFKRQKWF